MSNLRTAIEEYLSHINETYGTDSPHEKMWGPQVISVKGVVDIFTKMMEDNPATVVEEPDDDDFWYELQRSESDECRYAVPLGHTYCRTCGGAGGTILGLSESCWSCSGTGSFVRPDYKGEES